MCPLPLRGSFDASLKTSGLKVSDSIPFVLGVGTGAIELLRHLLSLRRMMQPVRIRPVIARLRQIYIEESRKAAV